MVRPRGIRSGLGAAAGVVLVDQVTKAVADSGGTMPRNPDLAFGVAHGPAPMLVLLGIFVVVVFVAVVGRAAVRSGIAPAIPGIIAGGVIANVIDRMRFGAVRDFIELPRATINLADVAIAGGMLALGIAWLLRTTTQTATGVSRVRWSSSQKASSTR
jgi:lipoprotein signal peptidase